MELAQEKQTNSMRLEKRLWRHKFNKLAKRCFGDRYEKLVRTYESLLTLEYQGLLSPRYAVQDIYCLEQLAINQSHRVGFVRPCQDIQSARLHFYSTHARFLDEYIPLLGHLGLRVSDHRQFKLIVDDTEVLIKSFTVQPVNASIAELISLRTKLLACLQAVMDGKAENDALNKLCVLMGMDWQSIDVLRTYRNYFLQLGTHSSPRSVHQALINNPLVALQLFNYFDARFNPNPAWQNSNDREEQALLPLRLNLLTSMADVTDINHDRILRAIFNLIDATMRSNFHWRRTHADYFIAIKINSLGVIDMLGARPQNEIYIHSATMEGIHLRAGKIARGGIRWSDRPDDFRTEILGLMQTQTSKNALIVPTGAKGGFVVKKNTTPISIQSQAEKAYVTLMRGLLDLTDNYQDGKSVKQPYCVCHDDPDPYLVVAADKGTAKFSDLANAVAEEYGFWLNEAFASGGSYGYDHKALGITARGAWECVKRHFIEMGKDIQNEAFSVVGVGSMDGDVFGNGMLLSPGIRLWAAFSGQHIFIDPNPVDSDVAFKERQRLFNLPGSTWWDYDRTLIGKGGGVYRRTDKDIPISPEIRQWLGLRYSVLDGETLIRYLLSAPADLLWLGGIGTYIKASDEKNETVGDHANDNVRIDACNLRAKVVGEGANLGFTQKARIEYALCGGRINTDAVDNSAGVDTSDHEVNLKILLSGLQKQNLINDYQPLFVELTSAICSQVLANNYAQSMCLSMEQRRSLGQICNYLDWAEYLQTTGFLDRSLEAFPSDKAVMARQPPQLTRPELAILMSASKMYLTSELLNHPSRLADDNTVEYLNHYFPSKIFDLFQKQLANHPLANEIKATVISNTVINQAGCGFLMPLVPNGKLFLLEYIGIYLFFSKIVQADNLRQLIIKAENKSNTEHIYRALLAVQNGLHQQVHWQIKTGRQFCATLQFINDYQQQYAVYESYINQYPTSEYNGHVAMHMQNGLPDAVARHLALLQQAEDFPQWVSLARHTGGDFLAVFKCYQEVSAFLGLTPIALQISQQIAHNTWEKQVLANLQTGNKTVICQLIKKILASTKGSCAEYFEEVVNQQQLTEYRCVMAQIENSQAGIMPYLVWEQALSALVCEGVFE